MQKYGDAFSKSSIIHFSQDLYECDTEAHNDWEKKIDFTVYYHFSNPMLLVCLDLWLVFMVSSSWDCIRQSMRLITKPNFLVFLRVAVLHRVGGIQELTFYMVTKLYSAQYLYEYWNSSKAILRNSKGLSSKSVYRQIA